MDKWLWVVFYMDGIIHKCKRCGYREQVKIIFTSLTSVKQRKGFFQSTQQLIPPKPTGWLRGKIWEGISLTSFLGGYQHKEPDKTVRLESRHFTDNRLDKIEYQNLNISPRLLEQLAKCYTGNLANKWSKANTKLYTRIGGTKHDKIKNEFLEAALLRCIRGEAPGCTEYELTDEGKEFLRRFL